VTRFRQSTFGQRHHVQRFSPVGAVWQGIQVEQEIIVQLAEKIEGASKQGLFVDSEVCDEQAQFIFSHVETNAISLRKDLMSPIATLLVGRKGRVFAAHEHVLSRSPLLRDALQAQIGAGQTRRVLQLADETPEILSSVLEYLYTGDYKPRLVRSHHVGCALEATEDPHNSGDCGYVESTIHHPGVGGDLLKDTAVYCAAEKYDLEELKEIALCKQGLRSGIPVDVIIRSARFAYDNTPDTDSRLRAHYLALIIRSRDVFKRSGTMQMEMEIGGSKL